jgi:predicted ATPase with chaperone activity
MDVESTFLHDEWILEDDFRDVKGQMNIKRAFEIAAAGSHNVI